MLGLTRGTCNAVLVVLACTHLSPGFAAEQASQSVDSKVPADASGLPESADNPAVTNIALYNSLVEQQLVDGDSYSPLLTENLYGLGKALREAGDYSRANDVLNQALHIDRVNNGLLNLSQEPLYRELMQVNRGLGDWPGVNGYMDGLDQIYLEAYGPDDPARLPILRELAHWHMEAFVQRGSIHSQYLVAAQAYAQESVRVVRKNFGDHDLQMIEPLRISALSNFYLSSFVGSTEPTQSKSGFYFGSAPQPEVEAYNNQIQYASIYRNGRRDYQEMVTLLYQHTEASHLERAATHAELGDWFLLFGKKKAALAAYQDSIALIEDAEEQEQVRKEVFEPLRTLPVRTFEFGQDVNQPKVVTVEAELHVGLYGIVRGVDIISVDNSKETDPDVQRKIYKVLKSQRFRPLLVNGEFTVREPIRKTFRVEI